MTGIQRASTAISDHAMAPLATARPGVATSPASHERIPGISGLLSRRGPALPLLAVLVVFGVVLTMALPLTTPLSSSATGSKLAVVPSSQGFLVEGASSSVSRDGYSVSDPPPAVGVAPNAPPPDPGSVQAIALGLVTDQGWNQAEFSCLVALWNRESRWNPYALNASSGAYGIPQALPGDKMASAGADWATNPETQIRWGIGYIAARYGTPCGAWAHSESVGWY